MKEDDRRHRPRVGQYILAWLGVLSACGSHKNVSTSDTTGTPVDTTTSSAPPTSEPGACLETPSTGGVTVDAGEIGGETAFVACPEIAGLPCTAPIDCADEACGSHASAFDDDGCPRLPCQDDKDCGVSEGCLLQENSPLPLRAVSCDGDMGSCSCSIEKESLVGVCVPNALLPNNILEYCDSLDTESRCSRFDIGVSQYCRWMKVTLFCDGICAPAGDVHKCIGFQHVGDICAGSCLLDDIGQGYSRARLGGAELLINPSCGDEPQGWIQCAEGETQACCMCSVT